MARGLYFTLTSGERVNFAQARSYEVAGADLLVKWNSGTAAMDATTYVGGAADIPAIDAFLAEPQDVTDVTPYSQQRFAEILYAAALNGFSSNQDILNGLRHNSRQTGLDPDEAEAQSVNRVSISLIDKFETEFP